MTANGTPEYESLLHAAIDNPMNWDRCRILADWCEEHDKPSDAFLWRWVARWKRWPKASKKGKRFRWERLFGRHSLIAKRPLDARHSHFLPGEIFDRFSQTGHTFSCELEIEAFYYLRGALAAFRAMLEV